MIRVATRIPPCVPLFTAHPITMCLIATAATVVPASCHLVEMATGRTHLGRVHFTDFRELNPLATALVFQVLFPRPEFQRPHFLVGPPKSAMPFFMAEGAEISGAQDREAVGPPKRDDLIRGVMQPIAHHTFNILANAVPQTVEPFATSRARFGPFPLF